MEQVRLELQPWLWMDQIERACQHALDDLTPLAVIEECKTGRFLAFVIGGCLLLILEVAEQAEQRVLNVRLLAGKGWDEFGELAMDFTDRMAREQGCAVTRVQGRPGWLRVLAGNGYKQKAVLMERQND